MSGICVIVGAGPGVGLAVARRFAREGFRIILLARRAEALDGYVAAMRQEGFDVYGFATNAADESSLMQVFDQVKAQFGGPEVLVYNAAALSDGNPSALDAERLVEDLRVNVVGALICARQVIPAMRAQQRGTILLTGGGLALYPMPQYTSLSIGKAALRSLCYSLGAELEPEGIHVATVTISGFVQPGSHFDPDLIAEAYWTLHSQQPGQQEREIIYR